MDDGGCTFSFLGLFSAEFTDKQPLQQLKGNKLIIFGGGTFVGCGQTSFPSAIVLPSIGIEKMT